MDPLVFGDYPAEMKSHIVDGRLPVFTDEEKKMVNGSFDYLGLNHYSSSFVWDNPTSKGGNWWTDPKTSSSQINPNTGLPIGEPS